MQRAVERRHAGERLARARIGERYREEHAHLARDIGLHHRVVDVADDAEARVRRRHQQAAESADRGVGGEFQCNRVPAGLKP